MSLNEKLENEQKLQLRLESVEESSKQQSPTSNQEQDAGDSIFGGIL